MVEIAVLQHFVVQVPQNVSINAFGYVSVITVDVLSGNTWVRIVGVNAILLVPIAH